MGGKMKDEQRLKLLNEFANDLSVVKGGSIKVTITEHSTHYEPERPTSTGMRYEDCEYLSSTLKGAESLLFFLGRNNYVIKKVTNR
jgi:hypothetical protein